MNTLIRIIVTTILSISIFSCNFSLNLGAGVDGNRNVVTKDRDISSNFEAVEVSQGLDLYITQSNTTSITVEADENLHHIIQTEVQGSTLKIYATENIRRAASRKIFLNVETIALIQSNSGSDVFSKNTIEVDELTLNSSSGSDIELSVKTNTLHCNASSGSDINLKGTTNILIADAASGSDIRAYRLNAKTSKVTASSGADISINTSKELTARATSGADIIYSGEPKIINKSDSSSGSVRQH